ncbi:DUF7344 domain-containing protein [Natrinema amylolyticum]|uniref:DUF7344 domain-containing protein n=1 Tax=Natrinema amylolyticum TaxID=2878679 RepID=UPI001CFB2C55|nr:hypothetical protein [Natrinema amylolyticum]
MVETDPDSNGGHHSNGPEREPIVASSVADGGVPDLDELLRVLSNRRRRCVLYCLLADDLRDVDALAKHVAARLERTGPESVEDARYEEIKVTLVHADIPMLAETGVVSYDRRTGDLRLDYPPTPIETLLESCAAVDEYADADEVRGDGSDRASSRDR